MECQKGIEVAAKALLLTAHPSARQRAVRRNDAVMSYLSCFEAFKLRENTRFCSHQNMTCAYDRKITIGLQNCDADMKEN